MYQMYAHTFSLFFEQCHYLYYTCQSSMIGLISLGVTAADYTHKGKHWPLKIFSTM